MFKVKPKVFDYISVVEIECPVCESDQVEPTSNEVDTWECCQCGMEFEIE